MNQPKIFLAIAVCCLASLFAFMKGCGEAEEKKIAPSLAVEPLIELVKKDQSTGFNTWRVRNLGVDRSKTKVELFLSRNEDSVSGKWDSFNVVDSMEFNAQSVCDASFKYSWVVDEVDVDTIIEIDQARMPVPCSAEKISRPWKLVQNILENPMGPLYLSTISDFQLSYNGDVLNPVEFGIEARIRFLNGDPMTMEEPDPVSFAANPVIQLK